MLDPRTHNPTTWESTNTGFWPNNSKPSFEEVEDSGICSPRMWATSPPQRRSHYRSLSPTSRTQAIVRGQRELMEMVKNMPESNYELSLKDLVEHHRIEANKVEESTKVVDRTKTLPHVKRKGNIDRGGFYLKMVLPFSFGSKDNNRVKKKKKKKKKNDSNGNSSSRVTPRPSDGSAKGGAGVDKEWWKKSHVPCRESDSGASSINSESDQSSRSSSSNSSSSRSNSRRENGGRRCWPFIRRLKRQTQK
ncbi:hypothetical protein Fmac_007650 [Flemingia macrophylla]|uniref:Uncharacterized protein n=1 Tax=Flemingia macrophylla TaxID=520843 RepID=A0ABD1MXG1_9FABA